jgi:antitoxin ParD1/3/4
MATINISLPDALRRYVEQRVTQDGYSTASEYFRELVRKDQQTRADTRLEALLLEGLDSPGKAFSKADIAEVKRVVRTRLAGKGAPAKSK